MNVLDWGANERVLVYDTKEVNWHRHMTRVDLAIDYYNTNLKTEPLANKVTGRKKSVVASNNRQTHSYDEQRSRAEAYTLRIADGLKPNTLDKPGEVHTALSI